MSECSVIGQPTGCYWLLKIAPFHSGFHPYPIIAIAAAAAAAAAATATAADDALVITVGNCDDVNDRGAVSGGDGDDAVNVRL